jgi:hypothetical protein
MTIPKLTALEHICLLVAAAGAGSKLVSLTPFWGWAIVLGVLVGGISFLIRKGWKPSL